MIRVSTLGGKGVVRVNSVIMAIDRLNGCTAVNEYPVSDDDVLLDAISRDTGMNITKEELDAALR